MLIVGLPNPEPSDLSNSHPLQWSQWTAFYSDLGLFLLAGRATTIGQKKTKEGAWLADVVLQSGSLNGSFKHQRGKSPLVLVFRSCTVPVFNHRSGQTALA